MLHEYELSYNNKKIRPFTAKNVSFSNNSHTKILHAVPNQY